MATATVINFGSLVSPSGDERIQPTFGSCMDLKEVVDSTCDQNADEFGIVGSSSVLRALLDELRTVAPTDTTVLIEGETGTGKELIARAIHMHSERRRRPFVKLNCAAIPAELLETELFGHERGAFTGAMGQRIGRFEAANGGTLFLDEIGEMPVHLQAKILRCVQEQEIERVGGNRTIQIDVRIVAATNRDLNAMVAENRFRADLYYRLAVFPLNIPPLRERREDIAVLSSFFVRKYARRMGREIETIPAQAIEALIGYDWPGNIRELQNVIERSVIMCKGSEFQVVMPQFTARSKSSLTAAAPLYVRASNASESVERARILDVLKETNGHVGGATGAAARLGLKRTTLQSRMRKYNIGRLYH